MSRGKGNRIPGLPGGNPAAMMNQIKKMQEDMVQAQEDLANEVFTISVGGGAVTLEITGHQRVVSVKLSPEAVAANDVEMLQDLLFTAINEAIETSQKRAAERMEAVSGGLSLPGLM